MKWIYILTTIIFGLLTGCQFESRPQSSRPLETGVVEEGLSAVPAVEVDGTANEPAPTAEATATTAGNDTRVQANNTGNADVLFVEARLTDDGSWKFTVTVEHDDTGWEDYADGWDVVLPDGTVVKPDPESPFTRLLLHPHENEQPFTRSQRGILIPKGIENVTVRAHDLVDGFGGTEVLVDITVDSGANFEVIR